MASNEVQRLVRDLRAAAHRVATEVLDAYLPGARVVEAVQGTEPGPLDDVMGVHVDVVRAYMAPDRLMLVYAYGGLEEGARTGVDYAMLHRSTETTALLKAALEWAESD